MTHPNGLHPLHPHQMPYPNMNGMSIPPPAPHGFGQPIPFPPPPPMTNVSDQGSRIVVNEKESQDLKNSLMVNSTAMVQLLGEKQRTVGKARLNLLLAQTLLNANRQSHKAMLLTVIIKRRIYLEHTTKNEVYSRLL